MFFLALAILSSAQAVEPARAAWSCANQLEVWCSADSCAASPPEEFTPMSIFADAGGASVCAYTGCWEMTAGPVSVSGRLIWTGDDIPFSSAPEDGMSASVTLLIIEADGVGFVRVGGFATPLLCERTGPREKG